MKAVDERLDVGRRTLDLHGCAQWIVDHPAGQTDRRGDAVDGRSKSYALDGAATPNLLTRNPLAAHSGARLLAARRPRRRSSHASTPSPFSDEVTMMVPSGLRLTICSFTASRSKGT